MRNILSSFLFILLVAVIVTPQLAEARAGGGRSMGSAGTRTYQSSPNVQPIQRSTTAQPSTRPAGVNPSQPFTAPTSHPFLYGLAGGVLGAGLAGMLFGGGGYGGMGGGGMGLLPILLLAGVAYFIFKRVKAANISTNDYPSNNIPFVSSGNTTMPQISDVSTSLAINDSDKHAFEQLLQQIQQNWSEGNLTRLRQFVTPEMVQYFSEELSANASRGLANHVEQVQLTHADISESWSEYDLDYTSAYLEWSALDYMVRLDREPHDTDYVASGSATNPVSAKELWTFVRAAGGHWMLSAIQQMQ
jgi:predicted lipid-binding transport protein (Tim44 family)